jgi:hypothetical protein
VGAPRGGDLTQPLGAGRGEEAKTAVVEAFEAPEPAQAALEEKVLETKSLEPLPDLPKPANPDVVEAKAKAVDFVAEARISKPRKAVKQPKDVQPPEPVKPIELPAAKETVTKRGGAAPKTAAHKTAAGEAEASARSEGKSKAKPAVGKTAAGKTEAGKTEAGKPAKKTAAKKTAVKTTARKTATSKTKGGR